MPNKEAAKWQENEDVKDSPKFGQLVNHEIWTIAKSFIKQHPAYGVIAPFIVTFLILGPSLRDEPGGPVIWVALIVLALPVAHKILNFSADKFIGISLRKQLFFPLKILYIIFIIVSLVALLPTVNSIPKTFIENQKFIGLVAPFYWKFIGQDAENINENSNPSPKYNDSANPAASENLSESLNVNINGIINSNSKTLQIINDESYSYESYRDCINDAYDRGDPEKIVECSILLKNE